MTEERGNQLHHSASHFLRRERDAGAQIRETNVEWIGALSSSSPSANLVGGPTTCVDPSWKGISFEPIHGGSWSACCVVRFFVNQRCVINRRNRVVFPALIPFGISSTDRL